MLTEAALEDVFAKLRARAPAGGDRARERGGRRAQGAYFTPPALVRFVVAETLGARLATGDIAWGPDGAPELAILDPAAGDGRFLVEAVRQLADRAAARGFDRDRAARAIARRCVVGVERDPGFAAAARRALGPGAAVHCAEALLAAPPALGGRVDAVVGNPPYVRSIRLGEADGALHRALRGRYAATSHGEWDLYAAFLEQALEWARPAGEIGLVVPSRWLTAAFAGPLRDKLARASAVRALVDFGSWQIFEGATTYASVAFLSRREAADVTVARLSEAGAWEVGTVGAAGLDDRPWRLSVGRRRELLSSLAGAGVELGRIARVAKGTGTNADRVFVLDAATASGGIATGRSRHLGRRVEVEDELAPVCVRGRDVARYGAPDPSVRCLVPYRGGALVDPGELRARYPRAAAYLDACRDRLEAREGGRFRGPRYYQFGRPQNLAFLADPAPKLAVPDVAREGRALLDTGRAILLDTAYAIRPAPGAGVPIELLLAVLNSPIVALWLLETGVRLRGDYVRMKTAYLAPLPVPRPSRWSRELAAAVATPGRAPDPGRVDDLLRRAYGLSREAWGEIPDRARAAGSCPPGVRR